MKKKIFIGLGVVLLAVAGYYGYRFFFVPPQSPGSSASISHQGLDVNVTYSQPSKRDRLIFGEEAAGALQPFGKYWRLGANAATEITFSKNIQFAGQPIEAGTYRMYAVPGATAFKIILNSELGAFYVAGEPNHDLDVLSVDVAVTQSPSVVEMFTISFSGDETGVMMNFAWDKTLFSVPITVQ